MSSPERPPDPSTEKYTAARDRLVEFSQFEIKEIQDYTDLRSRMDALLPSLHTFLIRNCRITGSEMNPVQRTTSYTYALEKKVPGGRLTTEMTGVGSPLVTYNFKQYKTENSEEVEDFELNIKALFEGEDISSFDVLERIGVKTYKVYNPMYKAWDLKEVRGFGNFLQKTVRGLLHESIEPVGDDMLPSLMDVTTEAIPEQEMLPEEEQ